MANKKNQKIKNTSKKISGVKKATKKILEYYYMTPEDTTAKDISLNITVLPEEKIEVWPQLDLLEVVMDNDSLIFQNGQECFMDPLDLEYIKDHQVKSIYQISFEQGDIDLVRKVMREVLEKKGGMVCSDTDDFEPLYTCENIGQLGAEPDR